MGLSLGVALEPLFYNLHRRDARTGPRQPPRFEPTEPAHPICIALSNGLTTTHSGDGCLAAPANLLSMRTYDYLRVTHAYNKFVDPQVDDILKNQALPRIIVLLRVQYLKFLSR